MNDTIRKFGYPQSLIKEYKHWVVLVRTDQVTLGSLILAHKGAETNMSDVPKDAFTELAIVTKEIERAIRAAFDNEKVNYLTLMMVDKEVHSHVIPRFSSVKKFEGQEFSDSGWPALPVLSEFISLDSDMIKTVKAKLLANWSSG